ncbi:aminoglycoside phosphotransferase family protein [Roseovarius dicentrarchi]|uniref:aminoglycoside phosphotransferase family protein n=1 Tax=Roseovarius dicentrarchi TaxID=2250573 RepID=UPI000DEAF650|nr:phosphotransferase [Roseovarius dicentrarchi]
MTDPATVDILPASAALLAQRGQGAARLTAFVADASPRRYYRLEGQGMLLMEDPTDPVGFDAYLRLSAHLNGLGLSAPRVIEADKPVGVALIEDLGDATYANCLASGQDEGALYRLAVDALLHLHHDARGAGVAQPRYDAARMLDELAIFAEWFVPAVAPGGDAAQFGRDWRAAWQIALAPVDGRFDTLVMRDFHVDNLMLLEGRDGVRRCGLLDFQDGVLGPCEYDLMSLLQDARRDLTPGLEQTLLERYLADAPARLGQLEDVRQRYHLLAAQRHARILGVFVRLCQRDGKPRYLQWMPRVLRQFQTALEAAELGNISALLDDRLPDWQGGVTIAPPPG